MAIYLYEFLYRGRPDGSAEPPAWHVIMADDSEDAFGRKTHTERMFTMEQAEEAGYALPELIATINSGALAEAEALRAKAAELESALSAKVDQLQTITTERDDLAALLDAATERLNAWSDTLEAAKKQRDESDAPT